MEGVYLWYILLGSLKKVLEQKALSQKLHGIDILSSNLPQHGVFQSLKNVFVCNFVKFLLSGFNQNSMNEKAIVTFSLKIVITFQTFHYNFSIVQCVKPGLN